jgi:succinyl-CoA synthetase beta subunit
MKIHEYQAKEILKNYNVPVQDGIAIKDITEFDNAIQNLQQRGISQFVVKSQIHAGGRGKGKIYNPGNRDELILEGGVKFTLSADKAKEYARKMLGNLLVTHQTGPEGKIVRTLFIAEGLDYKKELYLGILLDRAVSKNVIMASTEGGVEIEKVAEETPEKIIKEWIDAAVGLQPFQARKLAFSLGLEGDSFKNFIKFIPSLYKAYIETDASLLEINPLIITNDNKIVALDAKVNIDDNALYRHKDLSELRDISEEDALEVEASKYGLNYIKLDGNVGCMVNGAGLAMATMDIIKFAGGMPANFLDVGGGASSDQVTHAFEILLMDKNVKAVLINIFGGILRVDTLANGVVEAANKTHIQLPIVLRLEGTNVEQGREILKRSGLNFIVAETMKDAAEKVVAAAGGRS